MQRKDSFYTDTKTGLSHGDCFACTAVFAGNYHSLKRLQSFLRPIGPSVERMLSQMRANPPVRVQASAQRPTPSAQFPASNAQREAPGAQLR